jgi:predicted phosphodiesterase
MRILLVSDLHANAAALAVLPAADAVLCGGDLVDFGPDPIAAIDWCVARRATVVKGNHDFALSHGADCGVRGRMRAASVRTRRAHALMLDVARVDVLRKLPNVATVTFGGTVFALTHATPDDVYPYVDPHDAAGLLAQAVPLAQVLLLGHTHLQAAFEQDGRVVVNPGSVGLSTAGGAVQYAVWEDGQITLHTESYDADATIARLGDLDLDAEAYEPLVQAFRQGRRREPSDLGRLSGRCLG